jgi:hypothetical protein
MCLLIKIGKGVISLKKVDHKDPLSHLRVGKEQVKLVEKLTQLFDFCSSKNRKLGLWRLLSSSPGICVICGKIKSSLPQILQIFAEQINKKVPLLRDFPLLNVDFTPKSLLLPPSHKDSKASLRM